MSIEDEKTERHASCFIIEDTLNFNPERSCLYNTRDQNVVNILSTASGCLHFLIENQGEIVTKEKLIHEVWGKRGIVISHNTFYQTMLNLRRGLENAGIQDDIISTHYGKGVSISKKIKIIYSDIEISKPLTTITNDDQENLSVTMVSFEKTEINKVSHSTLENLSNRLKRKYKVGFVVFFLVSVMIFIYANNSIKKDYFSNYIRINFKINSCDVYVMHDFIDEKKLKKISQTHKLTCESNERIFITLINPVDRLSVIRCKKDSMPEEQCISDFYLD
ncbi:winged helix-turn-helix domain-containing protein [Klebsiella aerogenes]|uniref:winged helix-turn-helix domain-containing protein n=1 Tax=Klebsiella aerogenes TaxID=548 RepID=UPI001867B456|nr:winged helix-turn-helix domain-containing protein [Klebsiella aerogenes]